MFKMIPGLSPILIATTMVAGVAGQQATNGGQTTDAPSVTPARVTVFGCVVRNGSVDPDKGTRTLNIAPGALALTNARVVDSGTRANSAPGAVLDDHDSGTVPQQTTNDRPAEPSTTTFALTGDRAASLGDMVGNRVEIVGRFAPADDAPADQPRGTTGTAHPSAELRKLTVESFRGVTGGCE
jgi:hypothetical protein